MTVLITGASRGIGLGFVRYFLSSTKHKVVATCRNPTSASDLSSLVHRYGESRLLVLPLDVISSESHQALKLALSSHGIVSLDILIANAGIASRNRHSSPSDTSAEDMIEVFNTNCVGVMLTLQSYSDLLCKSNTGGLLVVVSSILGSIEGAHTGSMLSYRTSKAAVNMLTMTYVQEQALRKAGCKALCLHPGWVATDMGSAGGRTPPLTVDDSVMGMMQVMHVALSILAAGKQSHSEENDILLIGGDIAPPAIQDYSSFSEKFCNSNCVYVDYSGNVLPW